MRLFWFALKQCLNAFQTLAPARLATPAAGPFLPQNGRKNFASPHCASLQNFAFILVQSPLKIAFSCPFPPFPAFLHSSVPPRSPFITLHENSHPLNAYVDFIKVLLVTLYSKVEHSGYTSRQRTTSMAGATNSQRVRLRSFFAGPDCGVRVISFNIVSSRSFLPQRKREGWVLPA